MNEPIQENQQKIDFKAYYEELKKQATKLRDEICASLEISTETFYQKLKNGTFDYPQKVVIANIVGKSIDELFPL